MLDPRDDGIKQPKTHFPKTVDPWVVPGDPASGLLPGIHRIGLPEPGSADALTQAYNFRICLTKDPAKRIPLAKPEGYDPARFELLGRLVEAWPDILLHCHGWGKRGFKNQPHA